MLFAQRQEEHRQNLVRYQQAFSEAIEREFPLTQSIRRQLKQLQQSLQLKEEEVSRIEQPIIFPKEAEYRKQQDKIREEQEPEKQRQQEERDDLWRKVLRKLEILLKPPIQKLSQSKKKIKPWLLISLVGMVISVGGIHLISKKVNSDFSSVTTPQGFSSVTTPQGTWLYGGNTSWASIWQYVDPEIKKAHPQFKLRYTPPINDPPGSGTGIRMLLEGRLTFSLSSRPITDREYQQSQKRGLSLKPIPVALEGLGITVHPHLQIPGLTLGQIKDIYTGKITNWNQVGGPNLKITAYSRRFEDDEDTVEFFVNNVLSGEKLGSNVAYVYDTISGVRKLASDHAGIYYDSAREVVLQCTIKLLPIAKQGNNFVAPYTEPPIKADQCPNQRNQLSIDAFKKGQYPLTYLMFVIVKQNKNSLEQQAGEAYAEMLLTTQGQKLINEAGFVPIR
ncbi:MAG: substrate-binding domain-containing protein [Nostoc sp.]|uniref:PstS family phosphate ABC transporter substrate-binding protein n=1 Tax=Nostoc sp. TaxID=1180 RepID=UPI002FF7E870